MEECWHVLIHVWLIHNECKLFLGKVWISKSVIYHKIDNLVETRSCTVGLVTCRKYTVFSGCQRSFEVKRKMLVNMISQESKCRIVILYMQFWYNEFLIVCKQGPYSCWWGQRSAKVKLQNFLQSLLSW